MGGFNAMEVLALENMKSKGIYIQNIMGWALFPSIMSFVIFGCYFPGAKLSQYSLGVNILVYSNSVI